MRHVKPWTAARWLHWHGIPVPADLESHLLGEDLSSATASQEPEVELMPVKRIPLPDDLGEAMRLLDSALDSATELAHWADIGGGGIEEYQCLESRRERAVRRYRLAAKGLRAELLQSGRGELVGWGGHSGPSYAAIMADLLGDWQCDASSLDDMVFAESSSDLVYGELRRLAERREAGNRTTSDIGGGSTRIEGNTSAAKPVTLGVRRTRWWKKKVQEVLGGGRSLLGKEIADGVGRGRETARHVLPRLVDMGFLMKVGREGYKLAAP